MKNPISLSLVLLFILVFESCSNKKTVNSGTSDETIDILHSNERNFDFLLGKWHVENRVLAERLNKSKTWSTFDATLEVERRAFGQIDKYTANRKGEYFEGFTLRLYDPKTKLWSLYWTDNKTPQLQIPLVGAFENGVRLFYAEDTFNSEAIKIRFIWKEITGESAVWEQAFSNDEGVTWETNWIMNFKRLKSI